MVTVTNPMGMQVNQLESPLSMDPSQAASLRVQNDFHMLYAAHKVRQDTLWLTHDFNVAVALENFFPHDTKLHLSKSVTHTPVNTKTKREVLAGIGAINDELVRVLDNSLVTIPRDVPHNDLIAFFDQLAAKLDIARGDAAHMH